ncbi:MAG: transcriptional repressor [Parcubacteria group bacterium]|nr:transcriptional repressor [Parcubacteria group bacterium]
MESFYATRTDEMLRAHGLSRTQGRIALLKLLASQKAPVSSAFLLRKLGTSWDETTLYRALNTFVTYGILAQFDFGHGHAHYEIAHDKPHHHHAVCESCGHIEDIPAHDSPQLTASALKAARGFKRFTRHSLEFYGLCTKCT